MKKLRYYCKICNIALLVKRLKENMILQRYILKQIAVTFFIIFIAVTATVFVGFAYQMFRQYEGLGLELIVTAISTILSEIVIYPILISLAASIALTYGRLSADNELVAVSTSGVHINKVIVPAIFAGLISFLICYYLNMYVAPDAHYERRIMIRKSLVAALKSPPPGKTTLKLDNYRFSYGMYNDSVFKSPFIVVSDKDSKISDSRGSILLKEEYHAREGRITIIEGENNPAVLTLIDCSYTRFYTEKKENSSNEWVSRTQDGSAGEITITLEVKDVYKPKAYSDMSLDELSDVIHSNAEKGKIRSALREIHLRISKSLAPFFLTMIVIPIGIFVKKGSKLAGLGASLPPLLVYFILMAGAEGLGKDALITPMLSAYAPIIG